MGFKIGFVAEEEQEQALSAEIKESRLQRIPKKSVVQVYFEDRGMNLAYYNDQFDLHRGDIVYVDGKLEGLRGRVTDVNYNFRIKISEYKRVVAVVDTNVNGCFHIMHSHFLTFDREALPCRKVSAWFKAPTLDDEEYVSGSDGSSFMLDELHRMNVSEAIAERGTEYYGLGRVKYLCLDGYKGYALVQGTQIYELEFEYRNGEIFDLMCSCFCSYGCKHEWAAMLQLKEILTLIEKQYQKEWEETSYFAAIAKHTLYSFAIANKSGGSLTL